MPRPPFGHAGDDGAGLRDQCEVASGRHVGREACIELVPRHLDAKAVGTKKAHSVSASCAHDGFGQRALTLTQPGGHDDRRRAPS